MVNSALADIDKDEINVVQEDLSSLVDQKTLVKHAHLNMEERVKFVNEYGAFKQQLTVHQLR